jgi:hypothetical protein
VLIEESWSQSNRTREHKRKDSRGKKTRKKKRHDRPSMGAHGKKVIMRSTHIFLGEE